MPEVVRTVKDADGNSGLDARGGERGPSMELATPVKASFAFDLLGSDEEIDIMSSLPVEWFQTVEAKKWQERKSALDTLVKIVEQAKLMPTVDYSLLANKLMSIIQDDININVASASLMAVAYLSRGLGEHFREHAKSLFPVVLAKLKEKKDVVIEACHTALEHICAALTLAECWRFLEAGAKNKAPAIRIKALELLRNYLLAAAGTSAVSTVEKCAKRIAATLLTCTGDTQAAVRDASAVSFGVLLYALGEEHRELVQDCLNKLELQKSAKHCKAKINEFLESKGHASLPSQRQGSGHEKPAIPANGKQKRAVSRTKSMTHVTVDESGARPQGQGPPSHSTNDD